MCWVPLYRSPIHSTTEPELVAAEDTGFVWQLSCRSTAQPVEQSNTGQHAPAVCVWKCIAWTCPSQHHVTVVALAWRCRTMYHSARLPQSAISTASKLWWTAAWKLLIGSYSHMFSGMFCHVICQVSADMPLPMQLQYLYLEQNQLEGTLPESWRNLSKVSYWHNAVD